MQNSMFEHYDFIQIFPYLENLSQLQGSKICLSDHGQLGITNYKLTLHLFEALLAPSALWASFEMHESPSSWSMRLVTLWC